MLDWLLLIAGALLAGAGLPLALRQPFQDALWVATGMVGVGLVSGAVGLWRLLGHATEDDSSDARDGDPRVVELDASQVSALILHVIEEALEMLRLASSPSDLDEIGHLVLEVQTVASRLSLEKDQLNVRGAQARDILALGRKLAKVHRRLLERVGKDPGDAGPTLTTSHLQMDLAAQARRLDACSGGLVHLSRQFQDRPGLRDGLNSAAQSVRMYLKARGARLGSSQDEIALAPTVRLPDLPLLERLRAELRDMEEKHVEDQELAPDVLESAKRRLEKLAEATMPMGSQTVQPIVQDVSNHLKQAAESLGRGEVSDAASRVDKVLDLLAPAKSGNSIRV